MFIWNLLKSLSFGGLVGFGIFALIYLCFPAFFSLHVPLLYFSLFGAALGSCLHQAIQWTVMAICGPVAKFSIYSGRILLLEIQYRYGYINAEDYKRIKRELDNDFFLRDVSFEKIKIMKEIKSIENGQPQKQGKITEKIKSMIKKDEDSDPSTQS